MSYVKFQNAVVTDPELRPPHWKNAPRNDTRTSSDGPGKRLESVVVPLDGTPFAEHAIPLAISIAKRSGGSLKLIRVFLPAPASFRYRQRDAFDIMEDRLRTEASRYLDRVQQRILESVPEITVVTHLANAWNIVDGIVRGGENADLIVMATRGRGWLGRIFLGSVSKEMLHRRKEPTIYVRGDDTPVDFSSDPIPTHLSIAIDGSTESGSVFDFAGTLAMLSGAKSTLLHVHNPRDPSERVQRRSPWRYLNMSQRKFAKGALDVQTHLVRNAVSPTCGILSYVDQAKPDLLAVTTRVTRSNFRSTTENLIRKSPVPVLVVRESVAQQS